MLLIFWLAKIVKFSATYLNLGSGGTWPGHLVLLLDAHFIAKKLKDLPGGVVIISGTNGKTTTASIITHVLTQQKLRVLANPSGANLLNGIASAIIKHCDWRGRLVVDVAVLEVDENVLPLILKQFKPKIILLLNLFRDQLDRYGEVEIIINKWQEALSKISPTKLILNGEDPAIAYLGINTKHQVCYFGIGTKKIVANHRHVPDSDWCPRCGQKLNYRQIHYAHLGDWYCSYCQLTRPKLAQEAGQMPHTLVGLFNESNLAGAYLALQELGYSQKTITPALVNFQPVFGRGEILTWGSKQLHVFLSKNPTGFNETLATIAALEYQPQVLVLALNDNIPDGRDVSWLWDVDFEHFLASYKHIYITGTRAWDLALRVEYALDCKVLKEQVIEDYSMLLKTLQQNPAQKIPILATYSAMLAIRKLVQGRALL